MNRIKRMDEAGDRKELPPPLELECLNALWKLGHGNVSQVRDALLPGRPLAYTTVMTVLERLARRGMVSREKTGRFYRYSPTCDREEMRALAVTQLVVRFFDGSPGQLADYLAGMSAEPSSEKAARMVQPFPEQRQADALPDENSPAGAQTEDPAEESELPVTPPSSLDASLL